VATRCTAARWPHPRIYKRRIVMKCRCRNCGKIYEEAKSRADLKGYCGQACLHERARALGYKPRPKNRHVGPYHRTPRPSYGSYPSEYEILSRAGKIGSIPADD
jgi:hypothetical protein